MKFRVLLSAVLIGLYLTVGNLASTVFEHAKATYVATAAVDQLNDSNTDYVKSTSIIDVASGTSINSIFKIVLFGGLIWIWFTPIKTLIVSNKSVGAGAILLLLLSATHSYAYYSTSRDDTEMQQIPPNYSAFLVPQVGANKTGQGEFMSESYLKENKVAAKMVQIPHMKVHNEALTSTDYFIPAAKLYLVDRSPVTRTWNKYANKGTSKNDEGFYFESNEGINIDTAVTLSAYVKEEDTAKFLYWFGTRKIAETNDKDQIYASVVYGRSLAEVVDDAVRQKIQQVLSREFGAYPFNIAITKKAEIFTKVDKEVRETFANMGITILYVGQAEQLNFDGKIQDAINKVVVAERKGAEYKALMDTVDYEKAMVEVNFRNAQAEALKTAAAKMGPIQLPNWIVVPPDFVNSLSNLFRTTPTK